MVVSAGTDCKQPFAAVAERSEDKLNALCTPVAARQSAVSWPQNTGNALELIRSRIMHRAKHMVVAA